MSIEQQTVPVIFSIAGIFLVVCAILYRVNGVRFSRNEWLAIAVLAVVLTAASLLVKNSTVGGEGTLLSRGWPHFMQQDWQGISNGTYASLHSAFGARTVLYIASNLVFYFIAAMLAIGIGNVLAGRNTTTSR